MSFKLLFLFLLLNNSSFSQVSINMTEEPPLCQKEIISLRELNVPNHSSVDVGIFNSLDSLLFFQSVQLNHSKEFELNFVVISIPKNKERLIRLDDVNGEPPITEPVGWLNDSTFLFRKTSSDNSFEEREETLITYNVINDNKHLYNLTGSIDDIITSRNSALFTSASAINEAKSPWKSFQYTIYKYDFQLQVKSIYMKFPKGKYVSVLHYSDKTQGLTYFSNDSLKYSVHGKTIPIYTNRTISLDTISYIERINLELISWNESEEALYFFTSVSQSLYTEGFTGNKLYYILNRYNLANQEIERLDTLNFDVTKKIYNWQDIEITNITKMSTYHNQSFILSIEQPYNKEEAASFDIPLTLGQLELTLSGEINANKKLYVLDIK